MLLNNEFMSIRERVFANVASRQHRVDQTPHVSANETIVDPVPSPVNEFISMESGIDLYRLSPITTRQTLPGLALRAFLCSAVKRFARRTLVLAMVATCSPILAQVADSLDSYPPRWHLASSDCNAEVSDHSSLPTGGVGGSGCESIALNCGHGSEAILEYRIEPTRVLDELTAIAFVRSSKPGQRIGLRVRFPYLSNPQNRQSASVIVYGADYRDLGQWQKIGIGSITSQVRLKTIALRREFGTNANLDDPYIDAVVINGYTGAGSTQLSIDNVSVDGMIAVTATASLLSNSQTAARLPLTDQQLSQTTFDVAAALPPDRVLRILQHNGEPLDWVRTLGFDAVLISQPVNERLLRDALMARVKIIAPPPSSPDIALESLLEPLIAYYLGTSMNEAAVASTTATAARLRRLPTRWQRPLVLAPAESWRTYAGLADSVVLDLPSPIRGLAADEEIASISDRNTRLGRSLPQIIGIQTDAPKTLTEQLDNIAGSIGAPRGDDVPWHAMHLQVARALHSAPRAMLFRSQRTLTSGLPEDQRRSMALSYINRYLQAIGPVVAGSTGSDTLACEGARYRCSQLTFPGGQLIVASSYAQHRQLVLAGDGDTLHIQLPSSDAIKLAWRLTHFSAERIDIRTTVNGPQLELIAPDTVETIILSGDPEMGGRIAGVIRRVASQAAQDRWQLTREALDQLTIDWQAASGSRIVSASRPSIDLLNAAEKTLREAEPTFRSGDPSGAIRMARRADAWQLKSRWNLHAALSPGGQLSATTSAPPLLTTGGIPIQIMWWPLMEDRGWGENRLLGGSLDDASMLGPNGWAFGRRNELETTADVRIDSGRQVEGVGCLLANVASVSNQPLPGGYAGTAIQLRSPSVRFAAGVPVRIDAKIRTLGFGGPDQGVLVYDTIGGPELGVLVRAMPTWQTVRLYRQTIVASEVQALFEAIGAGEVMLDDVQIHAWDPTVSDPPPLRRIAERE